MDTCKVLRKSSHIMLALLLLVLTTGVTVSLHYCNHALYDIGVFTSADSCCMAVENKAETDVHDHFEANIQQKGHCEDETITVNSVDDFLSSASRVDFNIQTKIALPFTRTFDTGLHTRPNSYITAEIPERDNAPPGMLSEPSFLQSFLI